MLQFQGFKLTDTDLKCLGLHSKNMCLELVVVWYAGLLFEESTFFFSEIVQTVVQGEVAQLS
jgi:hypothetical protein